MYVMCATEMDRHIHGGIYYPLPATELIRAICRAAELSLWSRQSVLLSKLDIVINFLLL